MDAFPDHHAERVSKRNTALGRWMPAILYAVNVGGALVTAVAVGATDLLYLVAFPLPAIILYLWRTAKERP